MYSSRKAFSLLLCILGFAYGLPTQAHRLGNGYPRNSEGTPKNAAFIPAPSHITQNNATAGVRMSHAIRAKGAGSGETVNKKQLVAEVAQAVEMTQKDVGLVVDEFIKAIGKHLSENKEVSLPKFGVFYNSLRGARTMKNLQTGEMYTAKPVYVPNLRFYDAVKDEINDALKP